MDKYAEQRSKAILAGAKDQRNFFADHVMTLLGILAERDAEIAELKEKLKALCTRDGTSGDVPQGDQDGRSV